MTSSPTFLTAAVVVLLGAACFKAEAATSAESTNDLQLIPEDKKLWQESLLWDKDIVLRAGFGYKDNVLLSSNSRQSSPFFTSGLDLTIFRLPLDGLELTLSMIGDDVRYFRRPDGLAGEDLFLASAQVQKYLAGKWRTGVELRYSYIDQVLEEFLFTGGAEAVEAKGNTLGVRPFLRRDLSSSWWVQLEAPLARDWWQAPLDSSWKFGGQGIVGFSYGRRSQLALTGGAFYIPHDDWLVRNRLGTEVPNKRLSLWRDVAELKWQHQWDTTNRWSTTTKIGFNHSRDNGQGYFDYYRYYVSEEGRFVTKNWEAKATALLSYFDFPVQRIAAPPAPTLHLATLDLNLRLERRVYKTIRCYLAYDYEQTLSNDSIAEYHANTTSGGISWEF